MKLIRTALITCAVTSALALTACSGPDKAVVNQDKPAGQLKHVVKESKLYSKLPDDTLAYVRVPNIYSLTTTKDNALRDALGSEANVAQMEKLREAINKNVLGEIGMPFKPVTDLLLEHLRSPLELALVPNKIKGASVAMPTLMLQGTFDFADGAEFQAALTGIGQLLPMLQMTPDPADNSKGNISVGPVNIIYRYDVSTKHLQMAGGMGFSDKHMADFVALFEDNANNANNPMQAMEAQVDSSHKGLFVWASVSTVLEKYSHMIPPPVMNMATQYGVDGFNAIAIGSGTADKKGRTKIILDGAKQGALAVLPTVDNNLAFSTVGEPFGLLTVSSPSGSELKTMVENMAKLSGESAFNFEKMEKGAEEAIGITVTGLLDSLGPDHSIFADQIGEFMAVRIRDKVKFDAMLKTMAQKHQWQQKQTAMGKVKVNELIMPSMVDESDVGDMKELPELVRKFLLNSKSRIYYLVEGDYLILGQVPQLLVDRANNEDRVPVKKWLKESVHQDFSGTLIGAVGEFEQSPRKLYYAYLSFMKMLSDVIEADIDLYAFPSASDLTLPATGSYGFQIDSTNNQFAIELVYEVNPLEVVVHAPMLAVAGVGIAAAVAVPAYQSYTDRASFSEVISATAAAKTAAEVCGQIKGSFAVADCPSLATEAFVTSPGISFTVFRNSDTNIVFKAQRDSDNAMYEINGTLADGLVTWSKVCQPAENCM
ncbi:MAG: hypothetical protein HRT35_02350 [Algicola sp.]|nr:hypothetical protein [Algicola sp.]